MCLEQFFCIHHFILLSPRSCYTLSALPVLVPPPALTGFIAPAIPCSLKISSGGSPDTFMCTLINGSVLCSICIFFLPAVPIGVLMSCVLTAPKQQPHALWCLQTHRHFLFCSQENASSPLLCFHRDFKILLFGFQCLLDFFSKLLWGRETKLKGKHYALLTAKAPAAMTKALGAGRGSSSAHLLSLRTAYFPEGSSSLDAHWHGAGRACPGLPVSQ